MRTSLYLLLAAATSSLAFDYSFTPYGRHMGGLRRDEPPTEVVTPVCNPPIGPDSTIKKSLNIVSLGGAQEQLLEWCDKNKQIDPSLDNKGVFASAGNGPDGAEAQICNTNEKAIDCPPAEAIRTYFQGITCGTKDHPYLGGVMTDKSGLFFTYGPINGLGNCQSFDDTVKTWGIKMPTS